MNLRRPAMASMSSSRASERDPGRHSYGEDIRGTATGKHLWRSSKRVQSVEELIERAASA
jgi:hypothetical protein